jgi:DNA-binding transcriptional LysR family regulator
MNTKAVSKSSVSGADQFDWGLMRSFLAAFDAGSLLGAAKRTGQTQPTLGRQIAQLEAQLGVTLFERTGRGLAPTDAAHRLAEGARSMHAGALQAWAAMGHEAQSLAGTVRITASQPIAFALLPDCLTLLRSARPEINFELIASSAVSNLLLREADIAVRMVEPDQMTTIARRIGAVRICMCAHESYLARNGVPTTPQELPSHDFISSITNEEVVPGFARFGQHLGAERLVLRTDDLLAQWGAVCAGLGIGFISEYALKTNPRVRELLPEIPIQTLPVWLVVHREVRTNARIRAVYDLLGDELQRRIGVIGTAVR